jgi:hypothetical protein
MSAVIWQEEHRYMPGEAWLYGRRSMVIWQEEHNIWQEECSYVAVGAQLYSWFIWVIFQNA